MHTSLAFLFLLKRGITGALLICTACLFAADDSSVGGFSTAHRAVKHANALKASAANSLKDAETELDPVKKLELIANAEDDINRAEKSISQNKNTRAQLFDTPPSAIASMGPTTTGITNIFATICGGSNQGCTCNDAACTEPQITLPNGDILRSDLKDIYAQNPELLRGKTLQEALDSFDKVFSNAKNAAAAFNAASKKGSLRGEIGDVASADGKSAVDSGIEKDGTLDSKNSLGSAADSTGSREEANSNTKAAFAEFIGSRAPLEAVSRSNALTLVNAKTGKLLTIFERVTRAIRGERDRDFVLAKVEATRKEIIQKNKDFEKKNKSMAKTQSDPLK